MGLAGWETGGYCQHLNFPLCSSFLLPTLFWLHCGSPTCLTFFQNKLVSACVLHGPQSRYLLWCGGLHWLQWNICSSPEAAVCVRTTCSSMSSWKVAVPSENVYLLFHKPQYRYLLWWGHLHDLKRNLCSGVWSTSFLSLSDFGVHWVASHTCFPNFIPQFLYSALPFLIINLPQSTIGLADGLRCTASLQPAEISWVQAASGFIQTIPAATPNLTLANMICMDNDTELLLNTDNEVYRTCISFSWLAHSTQCDWFSHLNSGI